LILKLIQPLRNANPKPAYIKSITINILMVDFGGNKKELITGNRIK
jgi:hypothetical protein